MIVPAVQFAIPYIYINIYTYILPNNKWIFQTKKIDQKRLTSWIHALNSCITIRFLIIKSYSTVSNVTISLPFPPKFPTSTYRQLVSGRFTAGKSKKLFPLDSKKITCHTPSPRTPQSAIPRSPTMISESHEITLRSMAIKSSIPWNRLPRGDNKAKLKGNQWVFIVPKNKAGYLLGG